MGKLTISFEMTLDGAFDQMDQWFDENDAGVQRASDELVFGADAVLLGRESYEFFREYWPKQTDDRGFAAHYNALPKYVASRTLDDPEWGPATVLRDAAAEVPAAQEKVDGELQVWGSANLVQSLYAAGLVDRHHILTYPVVLGTGKRLFEPGSKPSAMRLVQSHATPNGTVISTYERAGEPTYEDVA